MKEHAISYSEPYFFFPCTNLKFRQFREFYSKDCSGPVNRVLNESREEATCIYNNNKKKTRTRNKKWLLHFH